MLNTAIVSLAVTSFALNVLLCAHTFLNAQLLRKPSRVVPVITDSIAVCVPARNEERNINACLRSILRSDGVPNLQVFVFNDDSSDDTARIVATVAASDTRVTVLKHNGSPPAHWLGKTWACETLRLAARSHSVLVFVDADVRLEADAIASGVGMLRVHSLQMVCPYPKQLATTWAERIVQPLLQWLWMTFLPLRIAERSRPNSMAAANGQFMIVDAAALHAVGGFSAVADDVLDDVFLARTFKRNNQRAVVVDGTNLATCRMYESGIELRNGYSKNLWAATGSRLGAFGLCSMLALVYLNPWITLLVSPMTNAARSASIMSIAAIGLGLIGRIVSARTTGGSVADSLLHPISIVALISLVIISWKRKGAGRLEWKGRALPSKGSS
jgi:glycosyltransferase involved in cell wall biosynthesis